VRGDHWRAAGCKPAIQQIENLRYDFVTSHARRDAQLGGRLVMSINNDYFPSPLRPWRPLREARHGSMASALHSEPGQVRK
jgi:hypothetical protein